MNTYYKFAPNVFLAKCDQAYKKGDVINVQTKYGKENESIVFNAMGQKDGFFYYSIVRADGYNIQERAKAKAKSQMMRGKHPTRAEISLRLLNLSNWDTIAKKGIGH